MQKVGENGMPEENKKYWIYCSSPIFYEYRKSKREYSKKSENCFNILLEMRNFPFRIDTKNTFSNYTHWKEIFTSSDHYYCKSKRQNEGKNLCGTYSNKQK